MVQAKDAMTPNNSASNEYKRGNDTNCNEKWNYECDKDGKEAQDIYDGDECKEIADEDCDSGGSDDHRICNEDNMMEIISMKIGDFGLL